MRSALGARRFIQGLDPLLKRDRRLIIPSVAALLSGPVLLRQNWGWQGGKTIAWFFSGYQNVTEIFSQRTKEIQVKVMTSALTRLDRSSIIVMATAHLRLKFVYVNYGFRAANVSHHFPPRARRRVDGHRQNSVRKLRVLAILRAFSLPRLARGSRNFPPAFFSRPSMCFAEGKPGGHGCIKGACSVISDELPRRKQRGIGSEVVFLAPQAAGN